MTEPLKGMLYLYPKKLIWQRLQEAEAELADTLRREQELRERLMAVEPQIEERK